MTGVPAPRDVPTIRRWMIDQWEPGSLFHSVAVAKYGAAGSIGPAAPDLDVGGGFGADNYARWERGNLGRAASWWIDEPMVDVLNAAARDVPGDVHLADLPDVPAELRCGFAVLARPFVGQDSEDPDRRIEVNAIAWGPTTLPPIRGPEVGSIKALAISAYQYFDVDVPDEAIRRHGIGGRVWAPLGRSDWPVDDVLDSAPWPMPDHARESFVEDRRLIAALVTLLHQPGLAHTVVDVGSRPERRRAARDGLDVPTVRIVTLRTLAHRIGATPSTPGERHAYDHQWIVGGHWRNQPYGPGRSLRRLQWIAPYVKGPEGTELRAPEVVRAWKH